MKAPGIGCLMIRADRNGAVGPKTGCKMPFIEGTRLKSFDLETSVDVFPFRRTIRSFPTNRKRKQQLVYGLQNGSRQWWLFEGVSLPQFPRRCFGRISPSIDGSISSRYLWRG